jgi:hypothetical protein
VALSFAKLQELLPDYEEYAGLFLTAEQALERVTPKTLLFVVDTHRVFLTAAPKLIDRVERRVVIDHHRRSEDFIPSPMIVYLEPSASSTSELVTELLVYFDEKIDTRLKHRPCLRGSWSTPKISPCRPGSEPSRPPPTYGGPAPIPPSCGTCSGSTWKT